MIRSFVGIAIPEPVAHALVALQAGLPAGRPVPEENLHLTLAFLGEQPEPVIEDVHHALLAIRAPGFELALAGLGILGERSRVLCAEARPEPMLNHLREKVLTAARGAGLRLDRSRFAPHVTVARFGSGLGADDVERMRVFAARRMDFRAGPFEVDEFRLYRSTLGRSGAAYQELASYPLEDLSGGGEW